MCVERAPCQHVGDGRRTVLLQVTRPADFMDLDLSAPPDIDQPDRLWTKLTAQLLGRSWFTEIAMTDPRFDWFTQEFKTYLSGRVKTLDEFIDLLANSPFVVEALEPTHVAHLLTRLTDYGDYLVDVTLEEELFSIVSVVAKPSLVVSVIDLFGWSGRSAVDIDEVVRLNGIDRDECTQAAEGVIDTLWDECIWTPALDRAIQLIADLDLNQPEELGVELQASGITEQAAFDRNGLRLACELFGKSIPALLIDSFDEDATAQVAPDPLPVDADESLEQVWRTFTEDEILIVTNPSLNGKSDEETDGLTVHNSVGLSGTISDHGRHHPRMLNELSDAVQPMIALGQIAAWANAEYQAANLDESLRCLHTAETLPATIEHAWLTLKEIDARVIGREFLTEYDPIPVLKRIFNIFTESSPSEEDETSIGRVRRFRVLTERVLYTGRKPAALQELGNELGITRERVRQLEVKVREQFLQEATSPSARPLIRAAGRLRQRLGRAVPISELTETLHIDVESDPDLLPLSATLEKALLWLAGPYRESQAGWLVLENVEVAAQTLALLQSATQSGPLSEESVIELVGRLGILPAFVKDWINSFGRFQFRDGSFIRWSGSFADKAEQILLLAGEPLSRDEIVRRVGESVSRGPVSSLPADLRFMRVSLTEIGLRSWGLEEYTTIEEEIEQEIERQGGQATSSHLVMTLAANFGVAEQSVRAYLANSVNFTRDVDGHYLNARRSADQSNVRPLEKSRRCYLHDGHWAYRYVVTADTVRGSGSGISTAFAVHLGATEPGSVVVYPSDFGSIRISRTPTGATIGTLRAVVHALQAEPDDYLFICRTRDQQLRFIRSPRFIREQSTGLWRLAHEVGLPASLSPTIASIAQAIGLMAEATSVQVRSRFRERMESELMKYLPAVGDDDPISVDRQGEVDAVSELLSSF